MKFVTIILIVILVIQLGLCAFFGFRKGWKRALMGLGFNLLSVLLAFLATKLVVLLASDSLNKVIGDIVASSVSLPDVIEILNGDVGTRIYSILSGLAVSIVAFPILYLIFYFLMKIPMHIINKKVFLKNTEEEETETTAAATDESEPAVEVKPSRPAYDIAVGIVACLVSGIISAFVFPMTIFGPVQSVYSTATAHESYQGLLPAEIDEIVADVASSPIIHADAVVTKPLFNSLVGKQMNEVVGIEDLAMYALDFSNAKDSQSQVDALEGVRAAFNNSEILSPIIAKVLSTAATKWMNGEDFLTVKVDVTSGILAPVYKSLLNTVANMTEENMKNNVNDFIDLIELSLTSGLFNFAELISGGMGGGNSTTDIPEIIGSFMEFASDVDKVTEFYTIMLNNNELSSLIPTLMASGMDEMLTSMGVEVPEDFNLDVDVSGFTPEEIKKESELTADVIGNLNDFMNEHEGFYLDTAPEEELGEFIDIVKELEDSKVAESVLPCIEEGIKEGLSLNLPDKAEEIANADSLSELAALFKK